MFPVNIYTDNMNVLFKRDKKFNPLVNVTDLVMYFRYKGKIVKRCPTIITKKKVLEDYKNLLELFSRKQWSKEEQLKEEDWNLCGLDNIKQLENYKKNMFRFIYDNPEAEEIHEDSLSVVPKNQFGYKPYIIELIMNKDDLTIDVLKKAAKFILKQCYGINVKLKEINFIKNMSEEKIEKEWKSFCDKKKEEKKLGVTIKERVIFSGDLVKELFGEDIRSVIKEKNKTTIIYEDGYIHVENHTQLKFFQKKKHKKMI